MLARRFLTAFVVAGALGGAVAAHHGWSSYDEKRPLDLTGVIREAGYSNPHGFVRLEVGDQGKVWYVVLAPPSRMEGRGLTREMLAVGTTASVHGYPHKQKADEMRAERITIGEKTTELR